MVVAIGFLVSAATATAATTYATSANFVSVFNNAAAGDRIILSGDFNGMTLANRTWATAVQIDASAARFNDTLTIKNVSGLTFTGGRFGSTSRAMRLGRAVSIYGGSDIAFKAPTVNGDRKGVGIAFTGTRDISVSNGVFSTLKIGMTIIGVTNGSLTGNRSLASSSDGMNIVDSHSITASGNSCSGTIVGPGFHPDCIQMWSLAGNPVQSDISLLDNIATGATQGFTSFDPSRGGGLRIIMRRNRVDTSYPQGIACYNCVDSIFADNVLTTLAGSPFRTSINIVGGSNNVIANNSVGARPIGGTTGIGGAGFAAAGAAEFEADVFEGRISAVPEPGVWVQLLIGFGTLGLTLRRRDRRINPA